MTQSQREREQRLKRNAAWREIRKRLAAGSRPEYDGRLAALLERYPLPQG